MISHTTRKFRELLAALPEVARMKAREAFRHFQQDPRHPGLQFKRVRKTPALYSARIDLDYRAVGLVDGETIVWLWVGSHADYEKLLTTF